MIKQEDLGTIRIDLNSSKRQGEVETIRLDLKTRIQLTASIIYSTGDPAAMTVKEAVRIAGEIEDASEQIVRQIKQNNPVYRENYNNRDNHNGK